MGEEKKEIQEVKEVKDVKDITPQIMPSPGRDGRGL